MKTNKERIIYFDLIKLIATISVFVCHFTRSLEGHNITFNFKILPDNVFGVYLGSFGVSLFFIVSGAALMYIYDEKLDVKTYLIKRLKGIYPLYWLTYLFAFFITFYNSGGGVWQGIPKYRIIFSILGCDGNVLWFKPAFYLVGEWFLSVIVLLYIIFPILRLEMNKNPYITLAGSIIIFIVCFLVWDSNMPLECLFLARLPEFVFGMFFVKIIKKPNLLLYGVGIFVLFSASIFQNRFISIDSVIATELIGIAAFCVLAYIFQWFKGKITEKISNFVNKYIYGVFLTHHFIQGEVLRQFAGKSLDAIEIILACILCLIVTLFVTISLVKLKAKIAEILTI